MAQLYTINHHAFDEPLSPEAEYWIGFLMADGNVGGNNGNRINLNLAYRDVSHVTRFASFIGSSHPIGHRFDDAGRPYAVLQVYSNRLVEQLGKYGVVPRKSLIAKAPDCLAQSRDFWRGVMDGDGSLGFRTMGRYVCPNVCLCGSEFIVEQFLDFVKLHAPHCTAKPRKDSNNDNSFRATAISSKIAHTIITVLYKDAVVALPRKVEIADQIMASYPRHLVRRKYSVEEEKVIISEYQSGTYCSAIAEQRSVNVKTIISVLKRNQIPILNSKHHGPQTKDSNNTAERPTCPVSR